jgi:hypothetical protein
MPANKAARAQRGIVAVEFSLFAMTFFVLFFGIIELARAMYICNTLQEVTRRAAALAVNTDFSDAAAMQRVRQKAIFRDSPGLLMFGDPVSDKHIKIDYLRIPLNSSVPVAVSAMPANPLENRLNCLRDAAAANCIRLVRVRVCQSGAGDGDACNPLGYSALLSVVPLKFNLPKATTIAKVETLGQLPGVPPCGC